MRRKREAAYAVKKSFSLPGHLYMGAEQRAIAMGFSTFSDYIQVLIRRDLYPANATPSDQAMAA